MRDPGDLARELNKIHDAVAAANAHFAYEAKMNAALHLSKEVRPAPLAAAIRNAEADLVRLISELTEEQYDGPISEETRAIARKVPTAIVPRVKRE